MAYGKVHTSFWTDRKVRGLSDAAKTLALYLVTGPHRNLIGAMRVPDGYIAADLGWSAKQTEAARGELESIGFILCGSDGWIHVVNQLRYDTPDNRNQAVSAINLFDAIDDDLVSGSVAGRLLEALQKHGDILETHGERLQEIAQAFAKGSERVEQASPTPNLTLPSPNHNHPSAPEARDSSDDGFDEWYREYPRHVGKGAARKAWRAVRKKVPIEVLMAGVKRYAEECRGKSSEFIAHPATWLNGERWADEPAEPAEQKPPNGAGPGGGGLIRDAVAYDDQILRMRAEKIARGERLPFRPPPEQIRRMVENGWLTDAQATAYQGN